MKAPNVWQAMVGTQWTYWQSVVHFWACGAVQWGSKSSQTDGIIALLQIEQPQRHEEGCNEGIQFVATISGDAMKLLTKGSSFLSMWGSAMGQQKQPD
jgi:hypothetical protein